MKLKNLSKRQNLLNINTKLVKNPKNLRIIQEAMFSSTNEIRRNFI